MKDTFQNRSRAAIITDIESRGLSVVPHGNAWRIYGRKVDMVTASLEILKPGDLMPASRNKEMNAE